MRVCGGRTERGLGLAGMRRTVVMAKGGGRMILDGKKSAVREARQDRRIEGIAGLWVES